MPLRMMMLMTRRRRRNGGFHMQHYCKALVAKLRIVPAQHSRPPDTCYSAPYMHKTEREPVGESTNPLCSCARSLVSWQKRILMEGKSHRAIRHPRLHR